MYEKAKSKKEHKTQLTYELLRYLVEEENLTDNEIAKRLGYNHDHIYSSRHKWNIRRSKRWKKVVGDIKLTESQQSFIEGTLLGDSTIGITSSGLCYYGCGHSTGQLEYLRYKAQILDAFLTENTRQGLAKIKVEKVSNTQYSCKGFKTIGHPIFNHYRELYYLEQEKGPAIKVFPDDLLKRLSLDHLAFWYLDDGELDNSSFVIGTSLLISKEIKTKIVKILWEKYNLNTCFGNISTLESGKLFCKFRILSDSSEDFYDHLRQYVTKDLMYKIPQDYLNGTPSRKIAKPQIVTVKRRFAEGKIFETRICQHPDCKKEFETNNASHSIYCSKECSRTGHDARKKEQNKAKRNKICKQCGQSFYDDSYANSSRYCLTCQELRNTPMSERLTTKYCKYCNKPYRVSIRQSCNSQYCSPECKDKSFKEHYKENYVSQRLDKGPQKKICTWCGESFEVPEELRGKGQFRKCPTCRQLKTRPVPICSRCNKEVIWYTKDTPLYCLVCSKDLVDFLLKNMIPRKEHVNYRFCRKCGKIFHGDNLTKNAKHSKCSACKSLD